VQPDWRAPSSSSFGAVADEHGLARLDTELSQHAR
jgi:hypothetical protein